MRRVLALLLLALFAAGCGGGPEPTASDAPEPVPSVSQAQVEAAQRAEAPVIPTERVPLAIRRQLERGEVGLVDAFGQTRIRPDRVDFAQDASLEGVRWSSWGEDGAEGTGTMRSKDCDPNCAEARIETVRATITLTAPRTCDGQRYFAASSVAPEAGEVPRSYVRAPC